MEKGHGAPVIDRIEKKDADYTGYSEKQADLNIDKGFKTGQIVHKAKKKIVTVFQKEDHTEEI